MTEYFGFIFHEERLAAQRERSDPTWGVAAGWWSSAVLGAEGPCWPLFLTAGQVPGSLDMTCICAV